MKKKDGVEKLPSPKVVVIPCELKDDVRTRIETYAGELKAVAPTLGSHGLDEKSFYESGLFDAAIERLRGQRAASMSVKRNFLREVLDYMKAGGFIKEWAYTGTGERHDYQVILNDDKVSIFEAKGCLDGNNTTIFQRPANADEFLLWSLCQNPGSDPKHNAWSGIHTRLGGKILAEKELVDGLIIWDMLCGTAGRPCPKLDADSSRVKTLASGRNVPPPCLYLFPRTIPDPRNNPAPRAWGLRDVGLLKALYDAFGCRDEDVTSVYIEARMEGANVQRRTILVKEDSTIAQSDWTTLKRATR